MEINELLDHNNNNNYYYEDQYYYDNDVDEYSDLDLDKLANFLQDSGLFKFLYLIYKF